jgi:hypothetical protein
LSPLNFTDECILSLSTSMLYKGTHYVWVHVVRLAEHFRSPLCSSLSSKDLFLFRGEVVGYVTKSMSWEFVSLALLIPQTLVIQNSLDARFLCLAFKKSYVVTSFIDKFPQNLSIKRLLNNNIQSRLHLGYKNLSVASNLSQINLVHTLP